jgi:hypothetical protein
MFRRGSKSFFGRRPDVREFPVDRSVMRKKCDDPSRDSGCNQARNDAFQPDITTL